MPSSVGAIASEKLARSGEQRRRSSRRSNREWLHRPESVTGPGSARHRDRGLDRTSGRRVRACGRCARPSRVRGSACRSRTASTPPRAPPREDGPPLSPTGAAPPAAREQSPARTCTCRPSSGPPIRSPWSCRRREPSHALRLLASPTKPIDRREPRCVREPITKNTASGGQRWGSGVHGEGERGRGGRGDAQAGAAGAAGTAYGVAFDECRCLFGARGQAALQADAADRRVRQGRGGVRADRSGRRGCARSSRASQPTRCRSRARRGQHRSPPQDRARADGDRDRRPHDAGNRDRGRGDVEGADHDRVGCEPAPK